MPHPLADKWRIEEMELWDREFIDLLGPGYIAFDDESSFIATRWTSSTAC